MNIISGNYGDNTIALIQWAKSQSLPHVFVTSTETGWAAPAWATRVERGEAFARACGFTVIRLQSPAAFPDQIRERKSFPNQKFQWCPAFLKGLPLLAWLDEIDPSCEATVLIGKRRAQSRALAMIPEFMPLSDKHGDRRVWYPLYQHNDRERDRLITDAGFEVLRHRSLECDPCIHNVLPDFRRMDKATLNRTAQIEQQIDAPMFAPEQFGSASGIEAVVSFAKTHTDDDQQYNTLESFDMGCGSPYGCGE